MSCPVGVGNALHRLGNYEGYVDAVPYGAYWKEKLLKVGPVDEFLLCSEDDDLYYRTLKAGGKLYMSPSIKSYYYSRPSLLKLWIQYFRYGFWRIPMTIKHRHLVSIRQVVPVAFVLGWFVLITGALFWQPARYVLAAYAGLYIMVLLIGAIPAIRKSGFSIGIATPLVFPILHFSYGLGCLWGIVRFIIFKGIGLPKPEQYRLSR